MTHKDEERLARNERSQASAERSRASWTDLEDAYITEHWAHVPFSQRDELGVARHLQRSVEACRHRASVLYSSRSTTTTTITTTTTTVTRRPGWMDDEELPDWYV